jgi:hypothetical protein
MTIWQHIDRQLDLLHNVPLRMNSPGKDLTCVIVILREALKGSAVNVASACLDLLKERDAEDKYLYLCHTLLPKPEFFLVDVLRPLLLRHIPLPIGIDSFPESYVTYCIHANMTLDDIANIYFPLVTLECIHYIRQVYFHIRSLEAIEHGQLATLIDLNRDRTISEEMNRVFLIRAVLHDRLDIFKYAYLHWPCLDATLVDCLRYAVTLQSIHILEWMSTSSLVVSFPEMVMPLDRDEMTLDKYATRTNVGCISAERFFSAYDRLFQRVTMGHRDSQFSLMLCGILYAERYDIFVKALAMEKVPHWKENILAVAVVLIEKSCPRTVWTQFLSKATTTLPTITKQSIFDRLIERAIEKRNVKTLMNIFDCAKELSVPFSSPMCVFNYMSAATSIPRLPILRYLYEIWDERKENVDSVDCRLFYLMDDVFFSGVMPRLMPDVLYLDVLKQLSAWTHKVYKPSSCGLDWERRNKIYRIPDVTWQQWTLFYSVAKTLFHHHTDK